MTFHADLHCHTTYSDGSFTPHQLISHAKHMGLSGISITDHETTSAYKEAIAAAQKEGIYLGSGVELSAAENGSSVHILGYDFDVTSADLQEFCRLHLLRRKERNRSILQKLALHQMPLDEDEFEQKSDEGFPVGRVHIALAMVGKGYVPNLQTAFRLYLGKGKSCYDPGMLISVDETIDQIHAIYGKAFIAHPFFLRGSNLISRLLAKPFDGIECYYARFLLHQEKKWIEIAKKKGWLISGGSDFHGTVKPEVPLGCSWVNEETFHQIFERHKWK